MLNGRKLLAGSVSSLASGISSILTDHSKQTSASSSKNHNVPVRETDVLPYFVHEQQGTHFPVGFFDTSDTANQCSVTSMGRDREARRSQSETFISLPKPSPISPLQMPNILSFERPVSLCSKSVDGNLRLSPPSVSAQHTRFALSTPTFISGHRSNDDSNYRRSPGNEVLAHPEGTSKTLDTSLAPTIDTPSRDPTPFSRPAVTASIRNNFGEQILPMRDEQSNREKGEEEEEETARGSVHLYSMRISHHLRSGSLLSWDQVIDASDLPRTFHKLQERAPPENVASHYDQTQLTRHQRQTSSSGFASSKVPSKWGKVLANNHSPRADAASSVYSSRPQSLPDGAGEYCIDFSETTTNHSPISTLPGCFTKPDSPAILPKDHDIIPKSCQRDVSNEPSVPDLFTEDVPMPMTSSSSAGKRTASDRKQSKFQEDISPSSNNKQASLTSILKFVSLRRLSIRSQSETNLSSNPTNMAMDGVSDTPSDQSSRERRQSRSMMSLRMEQKALAKNKVHDCVWHRALKAHQEEKAYLFLPKNRDLAVSASPFRERSGSVVIGRVTEKNPDIPRLVADVREQRSFLPSSDLNSEPTLLPMLTLRRDALSSRHATNPDLEASHLFEKQGDSTHIVGTWGRYPSHTRRDRTFSAGVLDSVDTRDFALEAAIRCVPTVSQAHDNDLIDPTDRLPSPSQLRGEKKRRKKTGGGRMVKSRSMTLGKTFLKNYSKIFKSQSTEFQKHGRGHRSSITSGGILEFPELELLPDVWTGPIAQKADNGHENHGFSDEGQHNNRENESKLHLESSTLTLRPPSASSAPEPNTSFSHDGPNDLNHAQDEARIWSVYYKNCVSPYPRLSAEADSSLEVFQRPSLPLPGCKHMSLHAHTMPARIVRHSRKPLQLSCASLQSEGSVPPKCLSGDQDDSVSEKQSLFSVRRSTMDLLSKFKEQELAEHDRVVALSRMES